MIKLSFLSLAVLAMLNSCAYQKFARKNYKKAQASAPYDVIIIPGTPYIDSTNSGLFFTARILWSKYLFDHHITNNIIYSGAAVSTQYYEGKAMKLIADSLGIPPDHTFSEIRAEHTTENAWYSMRMAHKLGFKKIAIASDPFQIKLLMGFLKKRCNNMPVIPIIYDSVIPNRRSWQTLLPKIDFKAALAPNYIRLSDREKFKERWRGTQGKHIKFDEPE